jgi:hypothetical protein
VLVMVQRRELHDGLSDHPLPERHGMFRIDYGSQPTWPLLHGSRR